MMSDKETEWMPTAKETYEKTVDMIDSEFTKQLLWINEMVEVAQVDHRFFVNVPTRHLKQKERLFRFLVDKGYRITGTNDYSEVLTISWNLEEWEREEAAKLQEMEQRRVAMPAVQEEEVSPSERFDKYKKKMRSVQSDSGRDLVSESLPKAYRDDYSHND